MGNLHTPILLPPRAVEAIADELGDLATSLTYGQDAAHTLELVFALKRRLLSARCPPDCTLCGPVEPAAGALMDRRA